MGDVAGGKTLHVAGDAVVPRRCLDPLGVRLAAGLVLVTRLTTAAVECHPFRRCRHGMRIVAGSAAQPAGTGLETAALIHLLDVADGPAARPKFGRADENGPELVQRQPRPVVERLPATPLLAPFTLEVALLADPLTQLGRQVAGIDNGVVEVSGRLGLLAPFTNVQLAGTVAALAANGEAAEEGRFVAIERIGDRLDPVGVTEQAARHDDPLARENRGEARRQVPGVCLREPAHRRLVEPAGLLD